MIRVAPGIDGELPVLQIGAGPDLGAARPLDERVQPFGGRRIAPGVEKEQIERRAEAFDLQLRRLDARFAEIVEHARADQPEDQADDREHDEELDEREAGLRGAGGPRGKATRKAAGPVQRASSVMLRRALMMETISAPMTRLTTMIVIGPIAPISRSRPIPSLCS